MPDRFFRDARGLWFATDWPNFPGFSDAFNDCLQPLSPAGTPPALSTYWIENMLADLEQAKSEKNTVIIGSGNRSNLFVEKGMVRAASQEDTFDDEQMSIAEFETLLHELRSLVTQDINDGKVLANNGHFWAQRNPI